MKIILSILMTLVVFLLAFIICAIKVAKMADERVKK